MRRRRSVGLRAVGSMRVLRTCLLVVVAALLGLTETHARTQDPQPILPGVDSGAISLQWQKRTMGTQIGSFGLRVADIDHDGNNEILGTSYGPNWFVLDWNGSAYVQTWIGQAPSNTYFDSVVAFDALQLDADPALEVLVGTSDRVYIFDGATRALQTSYAAEMVNGPVAAFGDIDRDGHIEMAFCEWGKIGVRDALTGTIEALRDGNCGDIAVGNVDDTPGLEIVVSRSYGGGAVFDGVTLSTNLALTDEQIDRGFALGDFDHDGKDELLSINRGRVETYQLDPVQLISTVYQSFPYVNSVGVADVDGDGYPEVIRAVERFAGGPQVEVRDGGTLELRTTLGPPSQTSFERFTAGDTDNDGAIELVWGGALTGSGVGRLFVGDPATGVTEFISEDVSGLYGGVAVGDVEGDGSLELVTTGYSASAGAGRAFADDAGTGARETVFQPGGALGSVRLANIDGDVQQEMFLGGQTRVVCLDGLTQSEQWSHDFVGGYRLELADVDLDGVLEVVVTGASTIRVLDARTGALEWEITPPGGGLSTSLAVRVGNIDSDPNPEIVYLALGVQVVDGVTRQAATFSSLISDAVELWDFEGDGVSEVVVLSDQFPQGVFRLTTTGAIGQTLVQLNNWPTGLAVRDLDGDRIPEIAVGYLDEIWLLRVGGCILGRTGPLSQNPGDLDGLSIANLDGDAAFEMIVRTHKTLSWIGFDVYELNVTPASPCIGGVPFASLSVPFDWRAEGNAGTTTRAVDISLSPAATEETTVFVSTVDGTATAGSDYVPLVDTPVVFAAGASTARFFVTVNGDVTFEPTETFQVGITSVTAASFSAAQRVDIPIYNDDLPTRTFVSAIGSNTNDCSVQTTPCRSIAGALPKTGADGEVILLGAGEYETAPLAITKGIKITAPTGIVAFIRQPITINAPGASVVLRGLTLKGDGTMDAITITAADTVSVEDTTVDQWSRGLRLAGTDGTKVSVTRSILRNSSTAIQDAVRGTSNVVAVDGVTFLGNDSGIETSFATMTVRDSAFVGNNSGVLSASKTTIGSTVFAHNNLAVKAFDGSTVRVGRSHVFGNEVGFEATAAATFESYGTNVLGGNTTPTVGTIGVAVER